MGALTQPAGRRKASTQPEGRRNPPPKCLTSWSALIQLVGYCIAFQCGFAADSSQNHSRNDSRSKLDLACLFDLALIRGRSRFDLGLIWVVRIRRQINRSIIWTASARPAAQAVNETLTQASAFKTCNICCGRHIANSATTPPWAKSKNVLHGLRKTNATVVSCRQTRV